jgi:hypothetical protein
VSPLATLEDGATERVGRRVHLAQLGGIRLRAYDPDPVTSADPGELPDPADDYLVAEALPRRVRIRIDTDEMRLLVWVNRHDLQASVVVPSGLAASADGIAPPAGGIGVFVEAGLPVVVVDGSREARRVTVVDPAVSADGWLPAAAIGDIFRAGPARDTGHPDTVVAAAPAEAPTHHLTDGVEIRDRPAADGRVLALAIASPNVRLIGQPRDGFQEVAYLGPRLAVHGFVAVGGIEAELTGYGSAGVGGAIGSPHRVQVAFPATACLFDRAGGEVVGRTAAAGSGAGGQDPKDDRWWYVGFWSPWGGLDLWLHDDTATSPSGEPDDTGAAPGPVQRPWERCPDPLGFR